jgi:DnaJ like chaperone protein
MYGQSWQWGEPTLLPYAKMNWSGKIIGGAVGMLALGPIGAALGAFIGHQFDSGATPTDLLGRPFWGGAPNPALVNQLFFPTTFRVMGHIAKADGRVSEQEIASARAIMHVLRLNEAQIHAAIGYFTEGKQTGFDVEAALRRLRAAIAPYPDLAQFFMEIELQAALAGNGLPPLVRARLKRLGAIIGVSAADFARLESMLRFRMGVGAGNGGYQAYDSYGPAAGAAQAAHQERLAQAYSVLAANPSMSDEQITKAYRRQMSRHHPDKLMANGLPESMLERAKERAQQIQAAYELIREQRGIR